VIGGSAIRATPCGLRFGVVGDVGARFGRRQPLLVDLAVDRERQCRQQHRRRRQHVLGQAQAQVLAQAAQEGLLCGVGERIVGVVLRSAGDDDRRRRCGVRRRAGGQVDRRIEEGRGEAPGIGVGPRDAHRVSMPLAQAPQRLRLHAAQRSLPCPLAQRAPGVAVVGFAQQIEQPQCRLDAGVGHGVDAHAGGTLPCEMRIERGQQIVAIRLPRGGRRGIARRRTHVQPDVVAVLVQFVVGIAALELDLDAGDRRHPLRQRPEERRRHQQFLLLAEAGGDRGAQAVGGRVVAGACELRGGVEGLVQTVVAHVADEDAPAMHEMRRRAAQHVEQVARAGEILDDRIQHDGVEVARDAFEIDGWPGRQTDLRQIVGRLQPALQARDRHRRQVGAEVGVAVRCQASQHEAHAAADLQQALRAPREDAHGRRLQPLPHLLFGDRRAGVAAVPADETRRAVVFLGLVGLLLGSVIN
jgi:hypothetical protein